MTRADFTSVLADGIARFLEHKRVLGRRYETEWWALRLFDRYLVEHRIDAMDGITTGVIDAFLLSRPRRRARSFNHLLGVLRRLFQWLVAREVVARSPIRMSTRRDDRPRIPFILGPDDVRRLLVGAARLRDFGEYQLRGATYRAIFAVLYGLGLRVGEVCRLNVADLDCSREVLIIENTKFGKDRLVPFGPRVGEMLRHYLGMRRARDRQLPSVAPFFSVRSRSRLTRQHIGHVFRRLIPSLELTVPSGASPPRVHDMRHSFAVATLLRWYRAGLDPSERLLHLSTFLGHVQPDSTAVYLTITAELLSEGARRFETFATPVVPEPAS